MSEIKDKIQAVLSKKYNHIMKNGRTYFVDDNYNVVASYDDKSITMYFDFKKCSREIWNHYGKVMVTMISDFRVNDKTADVLIVNGLCSACNDAIITEDFAYSISSNHTLCDELGEYSDNLGSCGELSCHNQLASINICNAINFKNIRVSDLSEEGFVVNIIGNQKENNNNDYSKVYEYWRKKNNWFYTYGIQTAGSYETRAWTERRRYSTTDDEDIYETYDYTIDEEMAKRSTFKNSTSRSKHRTAQIEYELAKRSGNDKAKSLIYQRRANVNRRRAGESIK